MPTIIATHSGPFHADDVLAVALLRCFVDEGAEVVRTRDPALIDTARFVVDVGGVYDPDAGRFDHHQASYQGQFSSAGMVLSWLEADEAVSAGLAAHLRQRLVDYVDAVDNGRTLPSLELPCFATLVEALRDGLEEHAAFDLAFDDAAHMARGYVLGLQRGWQGTERARTRVLHAMEDAASHGRAVIFLDGYLKWKPAYFAHGGVEHPTDFVLFPGTDGSWRVVAIPPVEESFAQKRPLPESWAGLTDQALEQATGVVGSVFCHKNRFIAVFSTRDAAIEALQSHGLMQWRAR